MLNMQNAIRNYLTVCWHCYCEHVSRLMLGQSTFNIMDVYLTT